MAYLASLHMSSTTRSSRGGTMIAATSGQIPALAVDPQAGPEIFIREWLANT